MMRKIRKRLIPFVLLTAVGLQTSGAGATQDGKPDAKKWDVVDPTGPTKPLSFDCNPSNLTTVKLNMH